eukprot:12663999-Alexandrium_andersonii.AAC.1
MRPRPILLLRCRISGPDRFQLALRPRERSPGAGIPYALPKPARARAQASGRATAIREPLPGPG